MSAEPVPVSEVAAGANGAAVPATVPPVDAYNDGHSILRVSRVQRVRRPLPSGMDQSHPEKIARIFIRLEIDGALIRCFQRLHFPRRNTQPADEQCGRFHWRSHLYVRGAQFECDERFDHTGG